MTGPDVPGSGADPFLEFDAAYVFGSLAPDERAAYERHLQHCAECRASVAAMAGIPGLLSRVPLERIVDSPAGPVPDTLLPRLVSEVGRERQRSRWHTGAAMALAAACVLGLLVALVVDRHSARTTADGRSNGAATAGRTGTGPPTDPGPTSSVGPTGTGPTSASTSSAPSTSANAGPNLAFKAVGRVDVSATAQIQSVLWGTRITMRCHEKPTAGRPPYSGRYYLVIVGRDHTRRTIADWTTQPGRTVHIEGDTAWRRGAISSLQLVDDDHDVVLTLAL